jgi:porphobilinogen deaminase
MNTIRIATRGSDQARTQAEAVGDALRSAWSDIAIEYVIVSTTGCIRKRSAKRCVGWPR